MRNKQGSIIPVVSVPSQICETWIYGGKYCYARECDHVNSPSPLDVKWSEECSYRKGCGCILTAFWKRWNESPILACIAVICGIVPQVRERLWVATADIKDMHMEPPSRVSRAMEVRSDGQEMVRFWRYWMGW